MAALAGLVPPLLVSMLLAARVRHASRRRHPSPASASPASAPPPLILAPPAALAARPHPARPATAPTAAADSRPRLARRIVDVELTCRACGWPLDRPGWVDGCPTSAICDCCACEAGVDDVTPERARAHRRRWVEHGAEWFDPGSRPDSWDLYAHLCELAPL
jgi:hypothetical protein